MQEYTQEQYQQDYAEYLDSLTPEEEGERKQLGGVFVGLLTRDEWERRDADMRANGYNGMGNGGYVGYLQECRINTENVRRRSEESKRHQQRFFEAERLGIPHHGQTDERL